MKSELSRWTAAVLDRVHKMLHCTVYLYCTSVACAPCWCEGLRTEKSRVSCWVHPPTFPAMGHSFVPLDPFQRVLKLSEDLLQGGLSFSIALRIEGSVDFSLSSGQKAVRLGAENTTTRGPSYTRRQIKRLMQKQMDPQTTQSTSPETVGGEERGGPGFSDNKSYPARDPRSEKIKTSQAERKTQTPVARMAPATSAAETQTKEDGWKQRSDEKKLRWISTKLASTSGQANSLQEKVDFHEKLHKANLRLFDYFITNLTTRGSKWRDSSADWAWDDKADLMTRIFGLPDEETLLQLLDNESQQSVNTDKTSDTCPNCESPSMSPTHICDDDDE